MFVNFNSIRVSSETVHIKVSSQFHKVTVKTTLLFRGRIPERFFTFSVGNNFNTELSTNSRVKNKPKSNLAFGNICMKFHFAVFPNLLLALKKFCCLD